jgi:hypothetical protein
MRTETKILLFSIILPALSFFVIYYIAKSNKCIPTCENKTCGQSDGCFGKCKLCLTKGETCDGTSCKKVESHDPYVSIDNTKGICYFDIDDTLTTANGNRDKIVKQCLDNNFAIGIVTASSRKVSDICNGNKAKVSWMSDLLCEQFQNNNGKMYNSTTVVAGSTVFPSDYPNGKSQGFIKGYVMDHGRKTFYPNVPEKCVVLFDDQKHVLNGVKQYNPNLETQCAGYHPGNPYTCNTTGHVLDANTVKNKVEFMKANGCV